MIIPLAASVCGEKSALHRNHCSRELQEGNFDPHSFTDSEGIDILINCDSLRAISGNNFN
jgi:hypothetical protein